MPICLRIWRRSVRLLNAGWKTTIPFVRIRLYRVCRPPICNSKCLSAPIYLWYIKWVLDISFYGTAQYPLPNMRIFARIDYSMIGEWILRKGEWLSACLRKTKTTWWKIIKLSRLAVPTGSEPAMWMGIIKWVAGDFNTHSEHPCPSLDTVLVSPVKILSLMVGCVAIEGRRHLGSAANNFTEDMLFLLPSNSHINITENVKRS